MSLEGKTALITGGGRGIGASIARRYAREGADVFLVSRSGDELKKQCDWITENTGRNAFWYSADVRNEKEVSKAVGEALKKYSGIDILVNSAGISMAGPSEEYPVEKWDPVIDINLKGTFLFCREVGKHFISSGTRGNIVNITSVSAHAAIPQRIAYASSKGGVKQLTQTLALEWGKHGIRVNAITPGYIYTELFMKYVRQGMHDPKKLEGRIPLGRMGEVEDLTGPAVFLASDDSAYVTGTTLVVDGGFLINGYV